MTSNPYIVDPEQLCDLCRKSRNLKYDPRPETVRRWARRQGIAVRDDGGRPWTTRDALNAALGVGSANDSEYQPDQIA